MLLPEAEQAFAFDQATDPGERRARPLGRLEQRVLGRVGEPIERHRSVVWPLELGQLDVFPPWACPVGRHCVGAP